ncbi:hypothetical protein L8Q54_01190 [Enterobacter kobei]|uniref:hypothetical protein n=1 Tax=Enterobacter kobei TaxID=208224 RepID=UPI002006B85C|nr:hypothetical protein [Enterobacter kobei]MCK6916909.1 hypothetical protein [Enterobacter kobei]
MERFVKSIRQSIADKNWFAAIFISLALPDICGAAETPKANSGERYKRWFNENLKDKYDPDGAALVRFTADDCYKFRCSCLHSGMSKDNKRHFKLIPPHGWQVRHKVSINGIIVLQIDILCEDICQAVEKWAFENRNNANVMHRLNELIRVEFLNIGGIYIGPEPGTF